MDDQSPAADLAEREHLSWDDVATLCEALAERLKGSSFDALLVIARGGLVPAALLAQHLSLRHVLCAAVASYDDDVRGETLHFLEFPPDTVLVGRRILVVDDIWDTGRTVSMVRDRLVSAGARPLVAVLHYKPGRSYFPESSPDIWMISTDSWVVYPWEVA